MNHKGAPQDSQTQVISKHTFQNSSHNIYKSSVKLIHKPITLQTKNKRHIHKHQTHIFEELVSSILPLLKELIKLGHAGIADHCYKIKKYYINA